MDTLEREQQGQGKMNFRCADVGPKTCDWQVSGNSEQEIMPKIEQHGREKHNLPWTMKPGTESATQFSAKRHSCCDTLSGTHPKGGLRAALCYSLHTSATWVEVRFARRHDGKSTFEIAKCELPFSRSAPAKSSRPLSLLTPRFTGCVDPLSPPAGLLTSIRGAQNLSISEILECVILTRHTCGNRLDLF